jgi:hypothetical protein
MKKNWQYFTHTTNYNFLDILNSNYLLPKTNIEEYLKYHPYVPEPYVYTHFIFNGLPQDKRLNWNNANKNNAPFIFVIDANIIKDVDMIMCRGLFYGKCIKNKNHLITKTSSSSKISLTRIKQYILNITLDTLYDNKRNSYIYTHEALFPDIHIQYIKAVLINKNISKKYIKEINIAIDKYPNITFTMFDHNEPNFDIYFENI